LGSTSGPKSGKFSWYVSYNIPVLSGIGQEQKEKKSRKYVRRENKQGYKKDREKAYHTQC
jgi:hypothetical protein